MKSTGIVRKLDELGRVTLPMELRRQMELSTKAPIEIFTDDGMIILRKYMPGCIFCGRENGISVFHDKRVCLRTCIHRLMQPSFRAKSPHAVAKYLVIRQYDCGILPCLRRFRLENSTTAAYEYRI